MKEIQMNKTIVITGAGSGFGALSASQLAMAGHTVYAGIRETSGRNADRVTDAIEFAQTNGVDLRTVELDVLSQESCDAGISHIIDEMGRLDVIIHNAGHMVLGPTEAFTPEDLAHVYDLNVLGTQRVNRSALPSLRDQGAGLLLWVGSTSTRGGSPPFLAPYFAAKAAMDSLAVCYAAELIKFGIDTTIVVPGAFTHGTNHFASSGRPSDTDRATDYARLYGEIAKEIPARLAALEPEGADVADVARAIVDVVALPQGARPFRVHIDPMNDGAEVVSAVADRMRVEFYRRAGLTELLGSQPSL
jgi:NAD(P)-dependent dehydrogenase (short-subunit alcohol dehydrogenase family)